jgi:predicted RNA binding protein YcfA (HicA-like mRNA interferase family)
MSKLEKLVKKILDGRSISYEEADTFLKKLGSDFRINGQSVSYEEAETFLKKLGFDLQIKGSHHVFAKPNYYINISLKKRSKLISYQIRLLNEVLKDHGY